MKQNTVQLQCNSTFAACFAFTGFGDGEEYPFDQDHGTQTNGTIAKGHFDHQCKPTQFACSSFGNVSNACVPNSYLCDVDDDCQNGSDEQLDFCASRWSDEEFGHSNCLEGEIFEQASDLGYFFQGLFGGRRRSRSKFQDLYDLPVSNTKANVNVSLSGARLTGSASTDFKMVMDRTIRREPQDAKVDLLVKIDDFTVKLRLTGDFTNTYKAFEKLFSRNIFRNYRNYRKDLFEILDVFEGTIDTVEQSIIGNVKGAYKKINSFAKWMFVNIENQFGPRGEDREWSTYGGEKIKADIKLKLNVGNENTADIKFNGELSEAAKEFVTNGYLAALNAKMEFCDDNKECTRMKICGKDLCNTFEPNKN